MLIYFHFSADFSGLRPNKNAPKGALCVCKLLRGYKQLSVVLLWGL